MGEHEISPIIALSPQKDEKWAGIVIILMVFIIIGCFIYTKLKIDVSLENLNETGKYYCEQNNDTLISLYKGEVNNYFYCNNTYINADGSIFWRREI